MVSDHGARAQPIRLGRELRAEAKFELPKLRGVPCSAADCHTLGRHVADLLAASEARLDGERPRTTGVNGKVDLKKGRGKATACGRGAAPGGSTFLPHCP